MTSFDTGLSPSEQIGELHKISITKSYIGREFLIWLWKYCEDHSSSVKFIPVGQTDPIKISFWVDDKIVFDSGSATAHQHTMRGGDPSKSPEAAVALFTGKTVKELRLGMHVFGLGDFFVSLNASDLAPRGVRLPATDHQGDHEDRSPQTVNGRIRQTSLLISILDTLFSKFIAARTANKWQSKVYPEIKEWMRAKTRNLDIESNIVH